MKPALVITARDNVATALEAIQPGRAIPVGDGTVTATDAIPRGHKIALQPIRAGDAIVKYGSAIGSASTDIAAGAHVHTHNLASTRGRGDLEAAREAAGLLSQASQPRIAEPPDTLDVEDDGLRRLT